MAANETHPGRLSQHLGEEHLLRLLLDGVEDHAIYALDPEGIVITWNTGATRLTGYTRDEAIGQSFERLFSAEDCQAGKPQALLALAASVDHAETEGWHPRKDGSVFWVHETYTALRNDSGVLIGFANVTRDRSQHRHYEERIRQLNRLYVVLSEVNQAIVRERDLPTFFQKVCQISVERGGFRLAWISLIDPQTQLPYIAGSFGLETESVNQLQTIMQSGRSATHLLEKVLATGERAIVEDVMSESGLTFWRPSAERLGYRSTATFALKVRDEIRGAYSLCADQPNFFDDEQLRLLDELVPDIAFAIEVSESDQRRQQALHELRDSEERYRSLIEHAPDAIFVNLAERVVLVNEACRQLFGASSADELLGKTPYDLFAAEQHQQIRQRIEYMLQSGEPITAHEEQVVRLDGVHVDVDVKAAPFTYGDAKAIHVILHDITGRKQRQAELLQLNAELEQRVVERTNELQMRNRELETFTYSVSHDLKAPLRGIEGYSRLLEEDYSEILDAEGRRFLSTIRRATVQMNQLIEDLLDYSRLERRTLQPMWVNPQEIVQALLAERSDEIHQRQIELHVALPAVMLNLDPEGLALALRNLIDNALKFTRTITVPVIEIGGSVNDSVCTLWVKDNGVGFDMKYHERIFDVFQRLHRAEDYSGTGVGLAIVRKAIERMGGKSWATSEQGIVTVFFLEMPVNARQGPA